MTDQAFAEKLYDRLMERDSFVLSTHVGADPDGVGAQLGLDYFLRHKGKEVVILNPDPLNDTLKFMDEKDRIQHYDDSRDPLPDPESLIVLLDNSDLKRSGDVSKLVLEDLSNLVIVDHHDGANADYRTYFQNPNIGSTCELVFELFHMGGIEMPGHIANAVYTGIIADTGHFRYGKTRPRTHEIAAELLRQGVKPTDIIKNLKSMIPMEVLLLKKFLYNNLQIHENKKFAWFVIQKADLENLGLSYDDLGGILDEVLEPTSIQISALFTERGENKSKVSLRSKAGVNVLPAVEKFGGGGHKNACGATIPLDLNEMVKQFIPGVLDCL